MPNFASGNFKQKNKKFKSRKGKKITFKPVITRTKKIKKKITAEEKKQIRK